MTEKELFSYDNYVFDLYGTLIDLRTDEHCDETWEKWIKNLDERGIKHPPLEEFRRDFFDKDREYREKPTPYTYPEIDVLEVYDELFTKYGNPPINPGELYEISYQFRMASYDYIQLFEGVPEFLEKLHRLGKKTYILSNAQNSYTLPEILYFGLDKMVDDYLISSDYRVMKPDKAFFSALVEKHNLDRGRSIMFGDSRENDYEGALASGFAGVWLHGEDYSDKFYKRYID